MSTASDLAIINAVAKNIEFYTIPPNSGDFYIPCFLVTERQDVAIEFKPIGMSILDNIMRRITIKELKSRMIRVVVVTKPITNLLVFINPNTSGRAVLVIISCMVDFFAVFKQCGILEIVMVRIPAVVHVLCHAHAGKSHHRHDN